LCHAHSSGISLLEEEDGRKIFRWHALGGKYVSHVWGTTPRDFSPCGTVLDTDAVQLMSHLDRHFKYFAAVTPHIVEALLVPFHVGGKAVGTVWVISHEETRHFDGEDSRVLKILAEFAAAAYQMRQAAADADCTRAQLEAIFHGMQDGVMVFDMAGNGVLVNEAQAKIYGFPSAESMKRNVAYYTDLYEIVTLDGILIPFEQWPVSRALKGESFNDWELRLRRRDTGQEWLFSFSGGPVCDAGLRQILAVVISRDVTARKRAEERLQHAQKLESIGLLAGGIAHDFNNLLVGVVGNASLAQDMLPPDHPIGELLQTVLTSGEQAAYLTRQLLAYAGKGQFLLERLNLSDIISELRQLAQRSMPTKIKLQLDLQAGLPPIKVDRGQLQQILMNLVLNAAEAIGAEPGLITVKTGVRDIDETYLRSLVHGETRAGKYVYLEVRDTGAGMDDETTAKIFDPFFSTKFTGRGLGLAAVAGIVRGHYGAMQVSSAPGKGTTFTIFFPVTDGQAPASPQLSKTTTQRGTGTVLLVDDEEIVRTTAEKALALSGYRVLVAESGAAAIDVFKRHPGEIAVVILDLSMPGMSGEETLPHLRSVRPDVPVIISSGYSEAEVIPIFKGQRVAGFIQKPYTSTQLAQQVQHATT
jgi:PAS domain S-box-containing protein